MRFQTLSQYVFLPSKLIAHQEISPSLQNYSTLLTGEYFITAIFEK